MKKILFLIAIVFLFASCSVSRQNSVLVNNQQLIFEKPFEVRGANSCLDDSFATFQEHNKYGKLYMEYLRLNSGCIYNGSIYSFFLELFESELKLRSIKKVEKVEFDNISFFTFKIDDDSYISMIFQYTTFEDLIIVDYEGKLSNELIKGYDASYKSLYLNKQRFKKDFNRSLARMNYFNSYFTRDSNIRISN